MPASVPFEIYCDETEASVPEVRAQTTAASPKAAVPFTIYCDEPEDEKSSKKVSPTQNENEKSSKKISPPQKEIAKPEFAKPFAVYRDRSPVGGAKLTVPADKENQQGEKNNILLG